MKVRKVRFGCGEDHIFASRDSYELLAAIDKCFNETAFVLCHHSDAVAEEALPEYGKWLKKALSKYIDATLTKYMHFLASDSVNKEK